MGSLKIAEPKIEIPKIPEGMEPFHPIEMPVFNVGPDGKVDGIVKGSDASDKIMKIAPDLRANAGVKYMDWGAIYPSVQGEVPVPVRSRNALVFKAKVQRVKEWDAIGRFFGQGAGLIASVAVNSGAPLFAWALPAVLGFTLMIPGTRQRLAASLVALQDLIKNRLDEVNLELSFEKLSRWMTRSQRESEIQNIRNIAEQNPGAFNREVANRLLGHLATSKNFELIEVIALLVSMGNDAVTRGLSSSLALREFKREGFEELFFDLLERGGPGVFPLLESMIKTAMEVDAFKRKSLDENAPNYRETTEPLREAQAWSDLLARMKNGLQAKLLEQNPSPGDETHVVEK